MPISGTEFEKIIKPFFKDIFEEMGFLVFEVRNQTSGTQNGFDIRVNFQDDEGLDRSLYIECKYYDSNLSFAQTVTKVIQLNGSNYIPDGFITLSPKTNISNINDNLKAGMESLYKFPIDMWTPDFEIENLFALDKTIFNKVYDEVCSLDVDRQKCLHKFKARINFILRQKDILEFSNVISIKEATNAPKEDESFVTSLDEKLNALDPSDETRIRYHQTRCNYKVYLEEQQDVNNILRLKILEWQDNLRLKAFRLTDQFKSDPAYTPSKFFHDFFKAAEQSLSTFFKNEMITGDDEKLLHGVVFELAAECPLDWRN